MNDSPDPSDARVHTVYGDASLSPLRKYALLAVGSPRLGRLMIYELVVLFSSSLPGALGYWLRRRLYRLILGGMGRNVTIGRHVTIRGGKQITLGDDVFIDDGCVLDARGTASIQIEDRVLIARNSIVRARKGVALLRPDGYVSVEVASFAPGVLTTHRFRQESGGTLRVNVDASAGELRYELLEDTGAPIPGFGAAECDPIRGDCLDAELSWRGARGWPRVSETGRASIPALPTSEFYVKLRCYIAPGTELYSVTLDPPEVTMWQARVKGSMD